MSITRRNVLAAAGSAAGLWMFGGLESLLAADQNRSYKVGACDWSIGARQQLKAFEVAKEIGLDGVQFSFDDVGAPCDLRNEDARRQVLEVSKKHRVAICSLAMGILNGVPYATDDRAEKWVDECIDVMAGMGQKVVLLAFFGQGDINGNKDLQAKVAQRLRKVAPKAEKAGVSLGIESWMSAADHMRLLDAVGSPAVKVYYDVANSNAQGYDIYKEIRQLGRERICEVHCKENGYLLGKGRIDFLKVKEALDDIGWQGWLVIEGATVERKSLRDCYVENQKYLRSVFPTAR